MEERETRWAAAVPRGRGDRLRALAAPALLIAIAALGVYRSATLDQSSWQGASFGMFATYDNRTSRTIVVTLSEPDGTRRVRLPAHLHDDGVRLSVVPTDGAAASLAQAVLDLVPEASAAQVEVWRLDVDVDEQLRVTTRVIAAGKALR